MDRITKFLRKLDLKRQAHVQSVADLIVRDELAGLDIKPIKGRKGWYRCRIGKIRLLFLHTDTGQNILMDVDFRGNIYK